MKSIIILIISVVLLSPLTVSAEGLGDMKMDSKIESMKKAGVGPVIFPHTLHEAAMKCDECHPKIFVDKRGANDLSMKVNMKGGACGTMDCHDGKRAHALFNCGKCHHKTEGQ